MRTVGVALLRVCRWPPLPSSPGAPPSPVGAGSLGPRRDAFPRPPASGRSVRPPARGGPDPLPLCLSRPRPVRRLPSPPPPGARRGPRGRGRAPTLPQVPSAFRRGGLKTLRGPARPPRGRGRMGPSGSPGSSRPRPGVSLSLSLSLSPFPRSPVSVSSPGPPPPQRPSLGGAVGPGFGPSRCAFPPERGGPRFPGRSVLGGGPRRGPAGEEEEEEEGGGEEAVGGGEPPRAPVGVDPAPRRARAACTASDVRAQPPWG